MAFIHGSSKPGVYGCGEKHDSVSVARLCDKGLLVPGGIVSTCNWLVLERGYDFDHQPVDREVECGMPSVETDRGFRCLAGHSHVTAEYRSREGWDYAEDAEEAYVLAYYGTDPVRMDGSGPSEMVRPAHFAG